MQTINCFIDVSIFLVREVLSSPEGRSLQLQTHACLSLCHSPITRRFQGSVSTPSTVSIFPSRNPAEMSHTCRGTISLHGALIHTVDACTFVVSNGGTQTFHIKASTEVERQQWVTALELAKAKAIQAMESGLYLVVIICTSLTLFSLSFLFAGSFLKCLIVRSEKKIFEKYKYTNFKSKYLHTHNLCFSA